MARDFGPRPTYHIEVFSGKGECVATLYALHPLPDIASVTASGPSLMAATASVIEMWCDAILDYGRILLADTRATVGNDPRTASTAGGQTEESSLKGLTQ